MATLLGKPTPNQKRIGEASAAPRVESAAASPCHAEALEAWTRRKARADGLAQRRPYAAEMLTFFSALCEVQRRIYEAALNDRPAPDDVARYAADHALPSIIQITVERGPASLSSAVLANFHEMELTGTLTRWLNDEELTPIERYLARASLGPVMEALAQRRAEAPCHAEALEASAEGNKRADNRCPQCNGLPQLAYHATSTEDLRTAHRYLQCSRCATTWPYPRLMCASCGETETAKLLVYAERGTAQGELSATVVKPRGPEVGATIPLDEKPEFPHVRIDGCQTCKRYLLTIDMERDGHAVPLVDEISAIPLDLYARERGLTKIVPNLMGM